MTPGQRRGVFWGVLGFLLLAGIAWTFRPQAVPVDLAEVKQSPLVVTVDEEGETRVRDVFVLSAPVAGRVRRIEIEAGDVVVAGETVAAEIEPIDPEFLDVRSESEAQAAARAAEAARALAAAELTRAEAELDFARNELARQQRLAERGAASERDLDAADREHRTAAAAVETGRAAVRERSSDLDRARARLVSPIHTQQRRGECDCIPVRAPVSGAVLRVLRESEGVVGAGDPLLEIGDPSNLEIIADLLSAEAVQVEPGQRVLVEEWGGDGALEGRVRRVEPYGFTKVSALGIEEQRVNVIVDFDEPPERWRRLGHGYRVEVRIVLWEDEDATQVPLSALFRDGERWAVFAESGGRARLRHVERGRHNGLEAEILSGVEPGERVVLYPSDRVEDGVRIAARG